MKRAALVLALSLTAGLASAGDGTVAGAGAAAGTPQRLRIPWLASDQGPTVFVLLTRYDDAGGYGLGLSEDSVLYEQTGMSTQAGVAIEVTQGEELLLSAERELTAAEFPLDPALNGGRFDLTMDDDGAPVRIQLDVTPSGPPTVGLSEPQPTAGPVVVSTDLAVRTARAATADVTITAPGLTITMKDTPVEFSREQWFFLGAGIPI